MSWLMTRQTFSSNNVGSTSGGGASSSSSSASSSGPTVTRRNAAGGGRAIDAASDCDPKACYDSFCKHWQQSYDIMQKLEPNKPPSHDDVLGVVNHLDHMVTLLLVELHHCNKIKIPGIQQTPPAPCLEFLLSENLLDKLYEWGKSTGRYSNAIRLEQLKLYELLVSHSRHQLLVHEPFLRPLLKILASSENEIFPQDIEKRLVILLNQLCVVLMQNVHLLDLFFCSSSQHGQGHGKTNFIIFSLLIPYVHRDGSIGQQARDALLLCMALSQKNSNIGVYIAHHSSMCPVLVTGLGGLYSVLPNTLEIPSIDWHRITADDIAGLPDLALFINLLEFCNAVVQVAHPLIRQQLLDFMYQGFVIPILGPALLQIFKGDDHFQNNIDSQISAMAYLDLILRTVTEAGLLKMFIKLLLDDEKFDGQRILDILVDRLNSPDTRLCMVTLSLFDTLLGLYCEDIMLELLLKFLLPCKHVPISQRHKINNLDQSMGSITNATTTGTTTSTATTTTTTTTMTINAADYFLELSPEIMKQPCNSIAQQQIQPISKTIGANWNHYGLYTNTIDSLYSNYYAYLYHAKYRIDRCQQACDQWSNRYRYERHNKNNQRQRQMEGKNKRNVEHIEMIRNFFNEFKYDEKNLLLTDYQTKTSVNNQNNNQNKQQFDSLTSLFGGGGESSSDYESFKNHPDDDIDDEDDDHLINCDVEQKNTISSSSSSSSGQSEPKINNNNKNTIDGDVQNGNDRKWMKSNIYIDTLMDLDFSEDLFAQGTVSLGPFINSIWGKLQTFTSNCIYVNFHLTGLISHLAWYPLPLIHTILLRPDIPTTSDTPSFNQVLKILKQQIDAELPVSEESLELIDMARSNLIEREFRLCSSNNNKNNNNNKINSSTINGGDNNITNGYSSLSSINHGHQQQQQPTVQISSSTPPLSTPNSSYDPFKRGDSKRRSFTQSISNIFRKPNLSSSSSSAFGNNIPLRDSTTSSTAATSFESPPSTSSPSSITTNNNNNNVESPLHNSQMLGNDNTGGNHRRGSNNSTIFNNSSITSSSNNNSNNSNSTQQINERTRDLAQCAVLLDEWLKELSAIAQEQSINMLSK